MKSGPVFLSRNLKSRYKFLGKVGKVMSYTAIQIAPDYIKKRAPYLVALIDFSGERAMVPIADIKESEVELGMRVVGVLRKLFESRESEIIVYGVKCVAVDCVGVDEPCV